MIQIQEKNGVIKILFMEMTVMYVKDTIMFNYFIIDKISMNNSK